MKRVETFHLFKPVIKFNSEQHNILNSFENNEKSFVKLPQQSGMTSMLIAFAFKEAMHPNKNIVISSPTSSMARDTRQHALKVFHDLQAWRRKLHSNMHLDFDIEYNVSSSMIVIKTLAGKSAIFNNINHDMNRGKSISHLLYDNADMGDSIELDNSVSCNAPRVSESIIIAGGARLNASLWASRGYVDAKISNIHQIYEELSEIG